MRTAKPAAYAPGKYLIDTVRMLCVQQVERFSSCVQQMKRNSVSHAQLPSPSLARKTRSSSYQHKATAALRPAPSSTPQLPPSLAASESGMASDMEESVEAGEPWEPLT